MFTQKCFIRKNNTPLILKLDSIGYKTNPLVSTEEFFNKKLFLVTDTNGYFLPVKSQNILPGCLDCGKNEELFIAIASIRDDSPYMQHFIYNVDTMSIKKGTWSLCVHNDQIAINNLIDMGIIRKASVSELIEHFKDKK